MKLTRAQHEVLTFLAKRPKVYAPPDGPEISTDLGHVAYWASGKLASLEKRGLVERLGRSFNGGICFRITPAGLSALSKEPGDG